VPTVCRLYLPGQGDNGRLEEPGIDPIKWNA
jgi:hypothetical protein